MPLRNGPTGYGAVTKTLHWLTVFLLATQFAVGYGIETASAWVSGTDDSDADEAAVFVHGWLGGAILLLATVRLAWRLATPLPPWSERLSEADRRLANRTEQLLYLLLFVIPGTGLALLLLSGEARDIAEDREWLPPYELVEADVLLATHVIAHITFYLALTVHIGLSLRRGTLARIL